MSTLVSLSGLLSHILNGIFLIKCKQFFLIDIIKILFDKHTVIFVLCSDSCLHTGFVQTEFKNCRTGTLPLFGWFLDMETVSVPFVPFYYFHFNVGCFAMQSLNILRLWAGHIVPDFVYFEQVLFMSMFVCDMITVVVQRPSVLCAGKEESNAQIRVYWPLCFYRELMV